MNTTKLTNRNLYPDYNLNQVNKNSLVSKKTNILARIAGLIMIVLGVINFIKGINILQTGTAFQVDSITAADVNEIRIAGILTLLTSSLLILCGGLLFLGRLFWLLSVFTITSFVVISIINSALFAGEVLGSSVTIDIIFAILILTLIYLGKKRL